MSPDWLLWARKADEIAETVLSDFFPVRVLLWEHRCLRVVDKINDDNDTTVDLIK